MIIHDNRGVLRTPIKTTNTKDYFFIKSLLKEITNTYILNGELNPNQINAINNWISNRTTDIKYCFIETNYITIKCKEGWFTVKVKNDYYYVIKLFETLYNNYYPLTIKSVETMLYDFFGVYCIIKENYSKLKF